MSRRSLLLYAVLGVITYLFFLVLSAPAAWLAVALSKAGSGPVALAAPRGTLWDGTAELYAGASGGGTQSIGNLRWRVRTLPLLLGRFTVDLELSGASQASLSLARSFSEYRLDNLVGQIPATLVGSFYAPAQFFAPTGTVDVKADRLVLSRSGLVGQARAQWQGAGGRFTGPGALGDYAVDLSGRGDTALIQLSTLRGDLSVTGQGQWHVTGDGQLQFTGSATPRGQSATLDPLLRLLGPDRGGGRRDLRFAARAPLTQWLGL